MGTAEAVVLALKVLAPTIEAIVRYLTEKDAPRPNFLLEIPEELRSEIELAKKLAEVAGQD